MTPTRSQHVLRILAVFGTLFVAACGGGPTPPDVTQAPATASDTPEETVTASLPDAPEAAPEATPALHPWVETPEDMIGQPLVVIEQALGTPHFMRQEGGSHLWRYDGGFGSLHVMAQRGDTVSAMRCYDTTQRVIPDLSTCLAPLLPPSATETF